MRNEFGPYPSSYESPFKGAGGGVEIGMEKVLAEVRHYWENFPQSCRTRELLAVEGLGEGRLIVINDSGVWLRGDKEMRGDKESGWWLAPWKVVLGRFNRYSELEERPWDRQEGFVAMERGEDDGEIRERRITSVEEVVEVLLKGRMNGLLPSVRGELLRMPPKGQVLSPGQLLTQQGFWREVLSVREGEVCLIVKEKVDPGRGGLEDVRQMVVPVSFIRRRGLGKLFRGERLVDGGGVEDWLNNRGGGRKKRRRKRRR